MGAAAAPLHTVPLVSSSMTILPHALWKPALEVVAFVGVVRLGLRQLETREKEEDDDASSDESRYPWYSALRTVPRGLGFTLVSDSCLLFATFNSLGVPLSVPLRTWAVGSLALSFPLSACLHEIKKRWGLVVLSHPPPSSPAGLVLWWTCFATNAATWSLISVVTGLTILSTVASVCWGLCSVTEPSGPSSTVTLAGPAQNVPVTPTTGSCPASG